jgi:hypothetical protein
VAAEVAKCGTTLAEIAKAQRMVVGGLAGKERLPIWSAERWAQARTAGLASLHELAADSWAEIEQYLHEPSRGMPIHLGFFLALSALFYAMRREVRRWTADERSTVIATVSERPTLQRLLPRCSSPLAYSLASRCGTYLRSCPGADDPAD